jgi:hypothetical protein
MIASLALISWVFWLGWMAAGLAYELFAVYSEKRYGTLPLTRVVRDRLMRRFVLVKLGVLLFLSWLCLHFFLNVSW